MSECLDLQFEATQYNEVRNSRDSSELFYGVYVPVDDWLGKLAISAGLKNYHFEKLRDRNTKWKNRKQRVPLKEGRLWIEK